ncbi:ectoine/hydroxyectoine ABC transporter permease subunit EhuD [Rhodoligotrophos defluvii]|uniref:ectoine/hydroxyectoine ABC transporter permease subunit EhuD n=1 Tax=Rhodoligotrophos defluvii TaxID=2561934 RepID=UPI0019601077|nr:ectoine/hydroxyectoine ABC transporter permease subunit EhuD [Rhodoligotrophos defluvii]
MPFDFDYARSILPLLLEASVITIEATVASFAVALAVGLILALLLRLKWRLVRWPLWGTMQFIRSTPLLVQLYFLFFVLPDFGIAMSPFVTGVIGLGLHYSCYIAEVYRAGLESVPKGQWEAATALNYGRSAAMLQIILPQAIPPIIPVLANYMIAMFKDTPILAAITVIELMQRANIIATEKFLYVEPMTLVGLLFLAMSLVASAGVRVLEARLAR